MKLHLVPVSFLDACGFVAMWHRHHQPSPGHKFSVGVADQDGVLRGIDEDGVWTDDGTRIALSVIRHPNLRGKAIHPTQKPAAILAPLIEYSVPPGGTVLDVFAGSCSTLLTARQLDRRSVGIEADEAHREKAAERLSVPDLFATSVAGSVFPDGGTP